MNAEFHWSFLTASARLWVVIHHILSSQHDIISPTTLENSQIGLKGRFPTSWTQWLTLGFGSFPQLQTCDRFFSSRCIQFFSRLCVPRRPKRQRKYLQLLSSHQQTDLHRGWVESSLDGWIFRKWKQGQLNTPMMQLIGWRQSDKKIVPSRSSLPKTYRRESTL